MNIRYKNERSPEDLVDGDTFRLHENIYLVMEGIIGSNEKLAINLVTGKTLNIQGMDRQDHVIMVNCEIIVS